MSNLGDHLDQAAGAPEPPLDVTDLQARAAGRARTRRRTLAGGAVAALLIVAALTFTAVHRDGSGQLVTASEGDGTATTEAPATTEPVVETTVDGSSTTAVEAGSTTAVPDTLVVTTDPPPTTAPPTTAPPTTTTTAVPEPGGPAFRVGGTYVGREIYRLSSEDCPAGKDLKHVLTSTFTVTTINDGTAPDGPWTYKSDYCSKVSGDSWSGSGQFAISMPDGSQLLGTFTDDTAYPTDGEPYTIQIFSGTGAYEGSKGECELTVHITDKVFGSQTQSGDFTCAIGPLGDLPPDRSLSPGGSPSSAAFG